MSTFLQPQMKTASKPSFTPVPNSLLQRKCACGGSAGLDGECEECRNKRLQRRTANGADPTTVPPIVHEVLRSPGQPLDASTRAFMEPRFGHDFRKVRVHSDAKAAESAQAVNARAYTVGRDVIFGSEQYMPSTAEGKRLLAHELTHILQQGPVSSVQQARMISRPGDANEQHADYVAAAVLRTKLDNTGYKDGSAKTSTDAVVKNIGRINHIPSPLVQRDVTRPRAATGKASIADVTTQTAKPLKAKATAGSLAAQEWESLFRRHFTEPDQVEDEVESSHARYIYSRIYGWIDAQHFFAHIQFAEESGLEGATQKGIEIEKKQEILRGKNLVGPDPADTSMYSDFLEHNLIAPEDFIHYREEVFMAINAGINVFLSKQERDLIKGFSEEQLAKLILDSAMSAWSYEDLVSNQLGVQFFRFYGAYINAGANPTEVRQRFIDKITEFFTNIQVLNDPKTVKKLAARLPGKERWTATKMSEAQARKKFPELFDFQKATHRVRIAVYDTLARAEKKMAEITKLTPSASPLFVAPYGKSSYALYTGARSHFEAIVFKALIDRVMPTGAKGAWVEKQP